LAIPPVGSMVPPLPSVAPQIATRTPSQPGVPRPSNDVSPRSAETLRPQPTPTGQRLTIPEPPRSPQPRVTMPDQRWNRLNLAWVVVFFALGCANLFVAFTFHEYWVDFKVFGSLGILVLATIAQIVYIYPYMNTEEAGTSDSKE
jgi:hypothetical protein